jgi:hypothetical protein
MGQVLDRFFEPNTALAGVLVAQAAINLVATRSLGGRRISVQTAEKSVSFVDTSSANSYGYWLVGVP